MLSEVERGLEFALRVVDQLDELRACWRDDDDPFVTVADKIVVESALLALVAQRIPDRSRRLQASLARAGPQLARHVYSARNVGILARFPHTAVSLGVAHVALKHLGAADAAADALLQDVVATGDTQAFERLPFRAMEVAWLVEQLTGRRGAVDGVARASVASSGVRPLHATANDVYALTHAVMYLTDFGARSWPRRLDRARTASSIESCLRWQLMTANFDLLGELLLAQAAIGERSLAGRLSWALLGDTRAELGFLPSPSFSAADYRELEGIDARAYAIRHVYHTEFVWSFLCAVALCRCRARAETGTGAAGRPAPGRLASRGSRPRVPAGWRPSGDDDLKRLERASAGVECSDDEWHSVVLDALVVHAARRYDLAKVKVLLAALVRLELPVTDTVTSAVEFLRRQSMASGAIVTRSPGTAEPTTAGRSPRRRSRRAVGGVGVSADC